MPSAPNSKIHFSALPAASRFKRFTELVDASISFWAKDNFQSVPRCYCDAATETGPHPTSSENRSESWPKVFVMGFSARRRVPNFAARCADFGAKTSETTREGLPGGERGILQIRYLSY